MTTRYKQALSLLLDTGGLRAGYGYPARKPPVTHKREVNDRQPLEKNRILKRLKNNSSEIYRNFALSVGLYRLLKLTFNNKEGK